jgi:CD109 antigen
VTLSLKDGIGIHWEPYPIETTGYAAMALLGLDRPETASAIEWLSTQRNSLGGYGESTQDTVVAIRALIAAAMKVRGELDLTLTVLDGVSELASLHIDGSNYDILRTVELPAGRPTGLSLRAEGSGSVGYQVARKYHVPGELLPPPRDMEIEVDYDAQGIEVDQIVDVKVRVAYTGEKKRTGMTIVDVAIPTGFEAVRASLDALVTAKVSSRIDVAGRKAIIYLDGLDKGSPVSFAFQVKALYPVKAQAPISRVYEYYDLKNQAYTRGTPLVVGTTKSFIRGDVFADKAIDLTDAIAVLGYLFLGDTTIACLDRADLNDDGKVEITDPIFLLNYLYLGGPAPAAPFPAEGADPTPDDLDC